MDSLGNTSGHSSGFWGGLLSTSQSVSGVESWEVSMGLGQAWKQDKDGPLPWISDSSLHNTSLFKEALLLLSCEMAHGVSGVSLGHTVPAGCHRVLWCAGANTPPAPLLPGQECWVGVFWSEWDSSSLKHPGSSPWLSIWVCRCILLMALNTSDTSMQVAILIRAINGFNKMQFTSHVTKVCLWQHLMH